MRWRLREALYRLEMKDWKADERQRNRGRKLWGNDDIILWERSTHGVMGSSEKYVEESTSQPGCRRSNNGEWWVGRQGVAGPAGHHGKEQNASHGNSPVPLLQATGPAQCFTKWVLETSTALM